MTTPLNPQSYSPQDSEMITGSQDPDLDLIVDHHVDHQNEEIVMTNTSNKIMLTISDDLIYTLSIIGDNLNALIESIRNDEQLKNDWNSWQRFVSNPNLFYIFIFDNDFGEYVRYRESVPINHLSKIKIKNRLYVNQSHSSFHHNGIQSLDLDEPTDALVCDQFSDTNNDIHHNQSSVLNSSQYHNYTLSSPSAPTTTTSSTHINRCELTQQNLPQTKASKKLFSSSSSPSTQSSKHFIPLESNSRDLLEDAPTGPMYDWTQEQTVTFLELCKSYAKELAPKKNVLEVKSLVWEQLSKELNTKGVGYFDALMCRNHFSRQRSTFTNILCYPSIVNETRWPYFDLMKEIIGEKPVEMSRQAKINAKGRFTSAAKAGTRKPSGSIMKNSANQEVSELYVALLNLVKKYMKYFETEKKYETWNKIEKEMHSAGYKWNANALRALFHRLRYAYLNLLRSVGDEELATASWPYFRYFQGIDLTAFRGRKSKTKLKTNRYAKPLVPAKRRPGRPRKHAIQTPNESQFANTNTDTINDDLNNTNCEVTFYEYSEDSEEGVENKKKIKPE